MKQKPVKLRHFVLEEPVFYATVHVLVGGTYSTYRKKLEKLKINNTDEIKPVYDTTVDGENGVDENSNRYIWIKNPTDLGTIQHETMHLAVTILHSKGIPVTYENQEVIAYYSEYWFKRIKELIQ